MAAPCPDIGDSWPDEGGAARRPVASMEVRHTVGTLHGRSAVMPEVIAGLEIPETAAVAEATTLIRETTSPLIYHHSRRGFFFRPIHPPPPRGGPGPRGGFPAGRVPDHRPPAPLSP